MTDNGARTLAERLHVMLHNERGGVDDDLARIACQQAGYDRCNRKAAAILANGAVFLTADEPEVLYITVVEYERLRRIEAAARDLMGVLSDWTDSDGRERTNWPVVDRDGESEPEDDVTAAALRAALQPEGSAGTPDEPPRDRIGEANALGYREGYRAGRAAGITEVIDSQRATEGSARDGG